MFAPLSFLLGAASLDPTLMERITGFAVAQKHWVLPIVFAVGLLKSTPVMTVFIPSTAMYVGLAAACGAGGGTFVPPWLAAAFGATAGDMIFFALGYTYRHGIVRRWPISTAPDLLTRGEVLFMRWGMWSVLGAKFVWGIRPFIPIIAGMYRMRLALFLAATNLSSLVWAAIGMGAGFGLWQLWR
jgi:membrane protein DedA with SNARE-associated domain